MPAFKKFGLGDQIDNILVLEPKYDLVSGSEGWRGSPEGSASMVLYGGARRSPTGVVRDIQYQTQFPYTDQFGVPTRSHPMTASIDVVWMKNEYLPLEGRTRNHWGKEYWDTIMRLYDDYGYLDPDFATGSYDFYSLYFHQGSQNIVNDRVVNNSDSSLTPTGSFSIESWVKPFTTSSLTNDFTIQSMNRTFWFGLTGSTGLLAFSASNGLGTSSIGLTQGAWSHVAVAFNTSSLTGTFYINLEEAGTFVLPTAIVHPASFQPVWTIGNKLSSSVEGTELLSDSGFASTSFHGLVGESRYWGSDRTAEEISGTYNRRLTGSELLGPNAYVQLNDGPLAWGGDKSLWSDVPTKGSGVLDQSQHTRGRRYSVGRMISFADRSGPVWQPSDNVNFYPNKAKTLATLSGAMGNESLSVSSTELASMVVIDIPSAFYGRQISPGTVRMVDRSYSSGSHNIVRTLVDDGRGGLYISGSISATTAGEYAGVGWNKVGNVFYSEGFITIKDPSLFDFGRSDGAPAEPTDTLQLSFRGISQVPVKTIMCRIERGDFNCSTNPTYWSEQDDGIHSPIHPSGNLYVTTVGLYNSDRELVGIARMADPVRLRPRDRINIKLRMDF